MGSGEKVNTFFSSQMYYTCIRGALEGESGSFGTYYGKRVLSFDTSLFAWSSVFVSFYLGEGHQLSSLGICHMEYLVVHDA